MTLRARGTASWRWVPLERVRPALVRTVRPMIHPGDIDGDGMFRMASAISQNPDKEFEMKPPPLEVSYEE